MKYFKMTVMLVLLASSLALGTAWARELIRYESRHDSRHQGRPSHHNNHSNHNHNHHHISEHHDRRHRGHTHYRVFIGAPYWWYYPRTYYYYYSAPVVVTPAPPVYIEPGNGQDASYWYYCSNPEGYYPYIKDCPSGWQKVVPHAPPS